MIQVSPTPDALAEAVAAPALASDSGQPKESHALHLSRVPIGYLCARRMIACASSWIRRRWSLPT